MADHYNKLAWFAVALAVLAWAFLPRLVSAHPAFVPKPTVVSVTLLPPVSAEPIQVPKPLLKPTQ